MNRHVFLFFGFIRKYKGLHNVIEAFSKVARQRDDVSLMIIGEAFWNTLDKKKFATKLKSATFGVAKTLFLKKQDDERDYNPLARIEELGIEDKIYQFIDFVPNEDVHKYFQVSDAIMLFYLTATPSGIESIAYNFKMPMLATKVGHFTETVKDGYNGYLAEPDNIDSMAEVMLKSIEQPIDRSNVAASAGDMSWENYALEILR
ncbi:MAG: glycosyltransferase [bacterium]